MTTVVYRDGVLASDSTVSQGDTKVPMKVNKISKLPSGCLYGFCGSLESGELIRRHLAEATQTVEELETHYDFGNNDITSAYDGLLIRPDGSIWLFENHTWLHMDAPYIAIGSGAPYALGALGAGASAKQAVKVAIKLDSGSGGRIQSLKVRGYKGPLHFVEEMVETDG